MFYACAYKDGKYGIADSSDATIEWLDYEALKSLLEEHPKLKVFGVTLSERAMDVKILRPNFDGVVAALRREFGYIHEIDEAEDLNGLGIRVKVGKYVSEIGETKPVDGYFDRVVNTLEAYAETMGWKTWVSVDKNGWYELKVAVDREPVTIKMEKRAK